VVGEGLQKVAAKKENLFFKSPRRKSVAWKKEGKGG
jgi:hypothetical protein